jgi:acyl dehydratase
MNWTLGDSATITRTISQSDVHAFADLSGDHNPIHVDAEFAASTPFGKPIAHGMLVASLFSKLLAQEIPGEGTVYLEQSIRFLAPVFVGDTVTATITADAWVKEGKILDLTTEVHNESGTKVISGNARVMVPR